MTELQFANVFKRVLRFLRIVAGLKISTTVMGFYPEFGYMLKMFTMSGILISAIPSTIDSRVMLLFSSHAGILAWIFLDDLVNKMQYHHLRVELTFLLPILIFALILVLESVLLKRINQLELYGGSRK